MGILILLHLLFFSAVTKAQTGEHYRIKASERNIEVLNKGIFPKPKIAIAVGDLNSRSQADEFVDGRVIRKNRVIQFSPYFPFEPGIAYTIFINEKPYHFMIKRKIASPIEIVSIYPTADTIPENILRIYLKFSGPVRDGQSLNNIQILNEDGKVLSGVFFDNQNQLWTPDHTMLTLLFDPGRVKTGLQANLLMGRALLPGHNYTLLVKKSMLGLNGRPMITDVKKEFYVSAENRLRLDTNSISVNGPKPGTNSPLILSFKQPLDYLLLFHFIKIRSLKDGYLRGSEFISDKERSWKFQNTSTWKKGRYFIEINPKLEDPEGNNFSEQFDKPESFGTLHNDGKPLVMSFMIR